MVDVESAPSTIAVPQEDDDAFLSDTEITELDDFSLISSEVATEVVDAPAEQIDDDDYKPLPELKPDTAQDKKKKSEKKTKQKKEGQAKKGKKKENGDGLVVDEKKEANGDAEDGAKEKRSKYSKDKERKRLKRRRDEDEDDDEEWVDHAGKKKKKEKDRLDKEQKKGKKKHKDVEKRRHGDRADSERSGQKDKDKRARDERNDGDKDKQGDKEKEEPDSDSESEPEDTAVVPISTFMGEYRRVEQDVLLAGRRSKFGESIIARKPPEPGPPPIPFERPRTPPRTRRRTPPRRDPQYQDDSVSTSHQDTNHYDGYTHTDTTSQYNQFPQTAETVDQSDLANQYSQYQNQSFTQQDQLAYSDQLTQQSLAYLQTSQYGSFENNLYSLTNGDFANLYAQAYASQLLPGQNDLLGTAISDTNVVASDDKEKERKEREKRKAKEKMKMKMKMKKLKEKERIKKQKLKEKEKKKKAAVKLDPNDPRYAEKRKQFKIKITEFILKRLKKYLQAQKITSKEDFKYLARKFSHKITEKNEAKGLFIIKSSTEEKIFKVIDAFFERHNIYVRNTNKLNNNNDNKDNDIFNTSTSTPPSTHTNAPAEV
jgi:hypothetical protein